MLSTAWPASGGRGLLERHSKSAHRSAHKVNLADRSSAAGAAHGQTYIVRPPIQGIQLVQPCACTGRGRSSAGAPGASPAGYQEFVFAEGPAAAAAVPAQQPAPSWTQQLGVLLKFSRPHTLFGTFVSVTSISMLSAGGLITSTQALAGFLQALISALLMNVCIVGINQIYDIEIDKVNKPYLPLASGELSTQSATQIVWLSGALSLCLGLSSLSMPLVGTLAGSLLLGIAYSTDLPFLRWKRYPFVAAGCILAVRAVLVQFGFYMHMQHALGTLHYVMSRPVVFASSFMLLFSVVIALFKDLPDVKGDSKAGVRTFSVRAGVTRIFWTCITLLQIAYAGGVAVGLGSQVWWSRLIMVLAHSVMGGLLYMRAKRTDLSSSKSVYACYMFIWKLFYAEYLVIPFLR